MLRENDAMKYLVSQVRHLRFFLDFFLKVHTTASLYFFCLQSVFPTWTFTSISSGIHCVWTSTIVFHDSSLDFLFLLLFLSNPFPVLLSGNGSWASSFCLYFSYSLSLGNICWVLEGYLYAQRPLGILWGLTVYF